MTDARGHYAFEKLGPGRYAASVMDMSAPRAPKLRIDQTIVVESGHRTTVSEGSEVQANGARVTRFRMARR
jgi:hypothetical protein